jgi:fructuronate reductase
MAHLGLGAFHRAHQAWWTGAVSRDDPWGIAAFTGRSPAAATALAAQDGLYTLLVRGATSDDAEVVRSISRAADGADTPAFAGCLANPAVRVLTLTVTEAGYCRGDDGGLAFGHPAVAADLRRLVHGRSGAQPPHGLGPRRRAETPRDAEPLRTAPGRVLAGLQERRRADAGPLALVPCDNLIDNGTVLRRVILEFADAVDPGLTGWIVDSVSFVSTAVDRITPRATGEDGQAAARITGWADRAPVVTEPFREWVLSGNFPGGRPAWEEAGAQFVPEVAPFEHRKLWLLNGAHSLLAYGGLLRGHITVAGAIADDTCRRWVSEWWDEASAHLPQPAAALADYREQLLRRFANPRIRHPLSQIAVDGSQKLRVRTVPVLRRERAAGRRGPGALRMLACWIGYVRSESGPLEDPLAARLRSARDARDFLAVLDAELAADDELCAGLDELAAEYREGR